MMSDADLAYTAAVAEIARVRAEGGVRLDLSGESFRALMRVPEEIPAWSELAFVKLSGTQVSSIAGVAKHKGIIGLTLDNTQVSDVESLADMTEMHFLSINRTLVSDITPVRRLTKLETLDLSYTLVSDVSAVEELNHLKMLSLSNTPVSNINALAGLIQLKILHLSATQISDLGALAGLKELEELVLIKTPVTDVSALAGLIGLKTLDLGATQVIGIEQLSKLTALTDLGLTATLTKDLRPICDLPLSGRGRFVGLSYDYTPAVLLDKNLAELGKIEDAAERTAKTLEYLKSLPKYPAPLPWLKGDGEAIPAGRTAPLQVIEQDGKLVALRGDTSLPDASDLLAAQAWAALRNFLDDMADQRGRVHNSMPSLARALARFEDALAMSYDLCDAIALGIHGGRVIALAPNANESLSKADAAEVTQLAAAIALFLERFPAWRAYRDDAHPTNISAKDVEAIIPVIRALDEELRRHPEIDEAIPKQLDALADAAMDAPDDPVAARGLIDSATNVWAALASRALPALKWVAKQPVNLVKGIVQRGWNLAADAGVLALGATAYGIIVNNAALLSSLAAKYPAAFEWLANLLRAFGL